MKKIIIIISLLITLFIRINITNAYFNTSNTINNIFKTESYKFTLNSNGGKYYNIDKLIVKNNNVILPIPEKLGYTFAGYQDNSGNIVNNLSDINNKTINATYTLNNYLISYDLNGGKLSDSKNSYNIEDSFTLPIPTKDGSEFVGWTGSNGITPERNVTIKNMTGNLNYVANWNTNKYVVDVNPIIQNTSYLAGLSWFTFSVWLNDNLVAENVIDYYNDSVEYGSKVRVFVNERDGYNITSFKDNTWTITSNTDINPTWYDNIAPTITSFSVTNLGYYYPAAGARYGWNIRVYVNGYDNGSGINKYQTWLVPYGNGAGAERVDGNDRTLTRVLYLNTSSGRTFCAYAIDNAGNEAEKCETIKVN